MNQTAKSLFTDWYNAGVKKEANAEELRPKREAIDKILTEASKDVWVDIANVYFGFYSENEEGFNRVAQYFKNEDEFFPLKNVNLLRVLSGCMIAEKIESNNDWSSDILALSVIINADKGDSIIPDLIAISEKFYITECEKKREKKIETNDTSLKASNAKPVMPTMTDHTGIPDFVKQLSTYLTSNTKDISQILNATNALIKAHNEEVKKSFDALSEETNILWWLFGEFSDTLNKSFSSLPLELLSVLTAIELQKLTTTLPGAGKITAIISKALSSQGQSTGEKLTIEQYITSTSGSQNEIEATLIEQPETLESITPIATALKFFFKFSAQEWKNALENVRGVDLTKGLEPIKIAEQLYRELMLLRVYKFSE